MRELVDSSALAGDGEKLRERIARDGYVFFRSLLDPAPIEALALELKRSLQQVGWLADDAPPERARLVSPALDFKNEGFFTGYTALQRSEAFHALPHQPALVGVMRELVGPDVFCHPRKVGRVVWPTEQGTTPGLYVHQDFVVEGVPDMFTSWVPLVDCPSELGGLAILTGSQNEGVVARFDRVDVDDDRWASTDFRVGDVLVFHCLTAHGARPNRTDGLRLSADFRWQSATQPLPADALRPHLVGAVPDWPELTAGWSTSEWVAVPGGVPVVDRSGGESPIAPPSAFVHVPEQSQRDGEHVVLAGLFNNMRDAFRPAKAAGRAAVVDYRIRSGDGGTHRWQLVVADDRCSVAPDGERAADVTIESDFRDYVRVVGGKLEAGQALAEGRLRISGEFGVAVEQLSWFRD